MRWGSVKGFPGSDGADAVRAEATWERRGECAGEKAAKSAGQWSISPGKWICVLWYKANVIEYMVFK